MTLPKWIEPKISVGTIVSVIGLLVTMAGAAAGYGALNERVSQHDSKIEQIEDQQAKSDTDSRALLAEINKDRVALTETLATLKTDVSYLRRWVEEVKRSEK